MKKFTLIAVIIIFAGLVIFNYVAANQAEKQIGATIQMQADSSGFSAQYSSIEVSPLRGNIDFSDITFVHETTIERANHVHIDLRYIDFLNIYFGGVKYGLENLSSANIQFKKLSYVNRETMQQSSLASADLKYNGNMWDGIRYLFMNRALAFNHQLNITASKFSYNNPDASMGSFKSDSAFFHFNWFKHQAQNQQAQDSVRFETITWTPPASFQQKYAFFIQGFGYKMDAIPISSFQFSTTDFKQSRIKVPEGRLKTDLFTIRFNGIVVNNSAWTKARLAPLNLSFVDLSPQFENILNNVEQLLGITIPKKQNKITFQLAGPLTDPHLMHSDKYSLPE